MYNLVNQLRELAEDGVVQIPLLMFNKSWIVGVREPLGIRFRVHFIKNPLPKNDVVIAVLKSHGFLVNENVSSLNPIETADIMKSDLFLTRTDVQGRWYRQKIVEQ